MAETDGKTSINEEIRRSRPEDAEDITEAFQNEYEKYYGKYVDSEELEAFLKVMNEELDGVSPDEVVGEWTVDEWSSDEAPEIVRTVEDSDGDFIGVGAIKFQDNLAELGSTIIREDDRSLRSSDTGRTVYSELFSDRLDTVSGMVADPDDPVDIAYTQLLADKSAATQHVANQHDFAVTGVYDKKFPMAYRGKGRVTVVDMIWADSHIENEQEQVYVPEAAGDIVTTARDNINAKRDSSLDAITRTVNTAHTEHRNRNYKVKPKAVGDPMNFAEVQIVEDESGDYTWNDVLQEIGEAQSQIQEDEDDQDYWIGLTLDANSPYLPTAAEELEGLGFEYAGFNPGKIDHGEENRDALEMQYRPSTETYEKQFVNEAADFIRDTGMSHGDTEASTGHETSEVMEI
ncbi:hypothetical protein ACK3SF_02525 [Candidatus Nanosalina sp. VS9-1]|uniref:hypothetical protein n=1 Tax=Candidatus Nanosalina sp. VS9-1 TaxID=3388566 RepID=UPI0039DFF521